MKPFMSFASLFSLFILSFGIGFFYIPCFTFYALGDLRESIVTGWVFGNFTFSTIFGFSILLSSQKVYSQKVGFLLTSLLLAGLVFLNIVHSMFYWDVISRGGLLKDDIGTPVGQANVLMFVWHLIIVVQSVTIVLFSLIKSCTSAKTGNIR